MPLVTSTSKLRAESDCHVISAPHIVAYFISVVSIDIQPFGGKNSEPPLLTLLKLTDVFEGVKKTMSYVKTKRDVYLLFFFPVQNRNEVQETPKKLGISPR